MKSFEQFQQDLREARETAELKPGPGVSHLVVDGIGIDKWIVDRFVPSDARAPFGGMQGSPHKKKRQALKAAKKIARTTGEEIKIGRKAPTGPTGPETLRARKK